MARSDIDAGADAPSAKGLLQGERLRELLRRSGEDLNRPVAHKDTAWLEDMLAYAVNLLSQAWDQLPGDACATTGPEGDPDRFDIASFIGEVRKFYPEF